MSTANTDVANANQARRAGKAGDLLNIIFDRAVASGLSFEEYVDTLDIDNSGSVSQTELGIILVNKGIKTNPKIVSVLFQKLDRNGSGKILGSEFNESLTNILKERAGEGGLFGAGLQPEKAVYGEQFLLQKLVRLQKEQSHFFRDFTKEELRTLMQYSEGELVNWKNDFHPYRARRLHY